MLKKWTLRACALISAASFADEAPPLCQDPALSVFTRLYTPPIVLRSKVEAHLKQENKTYRDNILATHPHVIFVPHGTNAVSFLLQHAFDLSGTHHYGYAAEGEDPWASAQPWAEYKGYTPKPDQVVKVLPGVSYRNTEQTLTGNFQSWKILRPLKDHEIAQQKAVKMPSGVAYTSPQAFGRKSTTANPEPEPPFWHESALDRTFSRGEIYFSITKAGEELVIVPSDWKTPPKQP
jgi:hypothetical protein